MERESPTGALARAASVLKACRAFASSRVARLAREGEEFIAARMGKREFLWWGPHPSRAEAETAWDTEHTGEFNMMPREAAENRAGLAWERVYALRALAELSEVAGDGWVTLGPEDAPILRRFVGAPVSESA